MLRITHMRGRRAQAVEHFGLPRVRIGSAPASELCFAPDEAPGVIPLHAEIRGEGPAYVIADMGSPAGIYVNRERVGRRPLQSGDVVMIGWGGAEFRVDVLGPPAPVRLGVDGKVDVDTAARIIQAAVANAAGPADHGPDPTPDIIHTKINQAKQRASRQNAILTLGVLGALAATLVVGVMVWRSRRATSALAEETGIDKPSVGKAQGSIPTRVYTGREIYEENKAAIYVIGYLMGNKVGGVCTAFAISQHTLATNAHCVLAFREKGGTPIVTQNESGGKVRFKILGAQMHPSYRHQSMSTDTPDVGILRVDGPMPRWTKIANEAELRSIGPGDDVFVLGFPGRVMDPISPSATFLQGHVGRVTGMNEETTTADKAYLVQHDAVTRGGNSGSPVFNQYGHVIAVHAAHLDEESEVKVGGQKTKVVASSPFRIGMRIDLLKGVPSP